MISCGSTPRSRERPEHGPSLHDQAGIDDVVALGPHQQRVREGDHAGRAPALLQLLVAAKSVGRVVDGRHLGLAAGYGEDVPLRGDQDVD